MTPYEERAADRIVPGWIVARRPDGTLLMRETPERRKQSFSGCLLFTVLWNGMVLSMLAAVFGLLPVKWDDAESSPRSVVLGGLSLFGILGLYGIYSVLQMRCGYQE